LPADLGTAVDEFVADGYNVVFTASSDFISPTQQAAVKYPESYFLSCCGSVSSDNLTSYFGRVYQPLYMAGYVAGKMSCTERIAVVAAKPVPQFVRHINAITLGARAANPNIIVDIRWLDSFFNPELEAQYAEDLLALGADVILTQTNSTIPVETVADRTTLCPTTGEQSPIWAVGYDNIDGCNANPDRCLTSAYWNWGPLYAEKVASIADGTWDPSVAGWYPMTNTSESVVGLAELSSAVPGAVRTEVSAMRQELIASTQMPFVGPISDNAGAQRVAAGDELDDVALDRLCWFVDGVVSSEGGQDAPAVVPARCSGDH
jgi:basic membrane protein A